MAKTKASDKRRGSGADDYPHEPCPEFGPGWTVQHRPRRIGKATDRYYWAPTGRRFRSAAEVQRYLAGAPSADSRRPSDGDANRGEGQEGEGGEVPAAAAVESPERISKTPVKEAPDRKIVDARAAATVGNSTDVYLDVNKDPGYKAILFARFKEMETASNVDEGVANEVLRVLKKRGGRIFKHRRGAHGTYEEVDDEGALKTIKWHFRNRNKSYSEWAKWSAFDEQEKDQPDEIVGVDVTGNEGSGKSQDTGSEEDGGKEEKLVETGSAAGNSNDIYLSFKKDPGYKAIMFAKFRKMGNGSSVDEGVAKEALQMLKKRGGRIFKCGSGGENYQAVDDKGALKTIKWHFQIRKRTYDEWGGRRPDIANAVDGKGKEGKGDGEVANREDPSIAKDDGAEKKASAEAGRSKEKDDDAKGGVGDGEAPSNTRREALFNSGSEGGEAAANEVAKTEAGFDPYGSEDEGTGNEPSPQDDDSEYTESNDRDDDNDDSSAFLEETSHRRPKKDSLRGGMYSRRGHRNMLDARVRVIGGRFEGVEGEVVDRGYGWETLDCTVGGKQVRVRTRDCEVLEWGNLDEGAGSGGSDDDGDEVTPANKEEEDDDLFGATVRVRGGLNAGMEGMINEVVRHNHVQLGEVEQPVDVSKIELVEPAEGKDAPPQGAPATAYIGATVRIKEPYEDAGVQGTVLNAVVGTWYITDNMDIANAYKGDKFEVIKYRRGVAARRKRAMAVSGPPGDGDSASDNEIDEEDPDASENDEDKKPAANPLIGVTVFVSKGEFEGLTGKILETAQRGWWTIDNPRIYKKVAGKFTKFVDDGKTDFEAIRAWYNTRRSGHMRPIVKPGHERDEPESPSHRHSKAQGEGNAKLFKRKLDLTDFAGSGRPKRLGVVARGPNEARDNYIPKRPRSNRPKSRRSSTPALDPILLQPGEEEDRLKLQLPAGLRHLPPDAKVEIFNRRTCRVMKGDDAILLSELPAALMNHAEYEPVIPPPANSSTSARIGRSGPNVRVNRTVVPQTRVRASKNEGRKVLVTGGEYRGLSGMIDSTIPGGWYLVSNLFGARDDMEAVVHSKNLELIPKKTMEPTNASTSNEGRDVRRNRIHLRAAKLRLEAFSEERAELIDSHDGREHAQARKLRHYIEKTQEFIASLESDLRQKTQGNALPSGGADATKPGGGTITRDAVMKGDEIC